MMFIHKLANTVAAMNGFVLMLALRKRSAVRPYIAEAAKRYYEAAGQGLAGRFPLKEIYKKQLASYDPGLRIELPPILHGGGGTSTEEVLHLAAVARVLQPKVVFEIGTFTGLTTCVLILNSAPGARVITVDLPPESDVAGKKYIETDVELVRKRKVGQCAHDLGLTDCYEQWFADSMQIDPTPLAGQVDLGFIDGSHALPYVVNDTEKMAVLCSDRSIVLWHDYGGVGEFLPLARYLEDLARKAPIYRIPGTTLAWAFGCDLKQALKQHR